MPRISATPPSVPSPSSEPEPIQAGAGEQPTAEGSEFDAGLMYLQAKVADRRVQSLPGLIRSAIGLVRKSSPRLLYASFGLQMVGAVLAAIQVYAGKVAIGEILRAQSHHGSLSTAVPGLAALLTASGISNALSGSQLNIQRLLGERVVITAWGTILDVTTSVDLATFESPSFFDELQRVEANALSRPVTLLQGLIALLSGVMSILGVCVALVVIAPVLLPILLLAGLPLAVLSRRGSGLEYRFQLSQSPGARLRYYLIQLQADRDHAKELRAFQTAAYLRNLWQSSYDRYFADLVRHVRRLIGLATASALVSTAVLAVAVGVVVELVLHHHLTLAAAGAGILAARSLSGMIASVFSGVQEIFECTLFLADLEGFTGRIADSRSRQGGGPVDRLRRLEIDHVSFTYPESTRPALSDVTLQVEQGQVVALVGENGSGKTTLAKLLTGLLQPTEGSIRWNGTDVEELHQEELSRQVAVIFQDFAKYAFSAADNIRIGDVKRPEDRDYTVRTAERAGVDEIVSRLDDGYDTMLGRIFGGVDLSIGQWQRVAIARAFYRDAGFLILDEPTSALDPRAEAALFDKMRELAGGRAVLIISHRFSTVRSADQIIVLEKGTVLETGTHDELMSTNGRYAELFELQARAYR